MLLDPFAESPDPNVGLLVERLIAPAEVRATWLRYGFAVILPSIGFLITWQGFDPQRAPYFSVFMTTVVITSLFGGWKPGLVNTCISSVLAFLSAAPAWTIRLAEREDAVRILLFTALGVFLSLIVSVVGELQRKLNSEKNTLMTTLRSIGDGVITTDEHGRVRFMNDVAQQATGWSVDEALGKPIEEIFPLTTIGDGAALENPVRQVLESGSANVRATDTVLLRRDGNWLLIKDTASPIRNHGKKISGAVLVFYDITQQKAAEKALHQSERLAALGRLATTVAHEINNPLEAVTNLVYLAKESAVQEDVRGYLRVADEELSRIAYITRQTLGFYRETKGTSSTAWRNISSGSEICYPILPKTGGTSESAGTVQSLI